MAIHRTPKLIASNQNAWLKEVQLLIDKSKVRQARGLFVVEGLVEIRTALRGGFRLLTLAKHQHGISWDDLLTHIELSADVEFLELADLPWEKVVTRKTGVNALAVFQRDDRFDRLWDPAPHEIWLAVESVEKPGNLGAILRSADASGISGVVICDGLSDVLHPQVIRNSLGAVCTVPIFCLTKEQLWQYAQDKGLHLYSTFMENSTSCYKMNLGKGAVLIMGAEHQGVSDFWRGKVTNLQIPMEGQVDSLNVSVAAALLMYEAKRQQGGTAE
jgi:TrmH family RNA methyltransferase